MKKNKITESKLFKELISDENIFSAIYSIKSYIFEKNLLSEDDLELYYALQDKYNTKLIKKTISKCKKHIKSIIQKKQLFKICVYFKAKKYNKDADKIECRPLHTADLITQICIVCFLNLIMFKKNSNGKRILSDLSQLLPSTFYGNLPSDEYEYIFYDWKEKYKLYTENVINEYNKARDTGIYKYEVRIDIQKYFPSISPIYIYEYIIGKIGKSFSSVDLRCLKIILEKLLCFEIVNIKTKECFQEYYDNKINFNKHNSPFPNVGVPQGLPQSYFFGNIAMIAISNEFKKIFPGVAFYYVDDSVIYTNDENAKEEKFEKSLINLNKKIAEKIDVYRKKTTELKSFNVHKKMKYEIKVHDSNGKSTSAKISSNSKITKTFLQSLSLEASRVSFEFYNTLAESQDITIQGKIEALLNGIEQELDSISKNNNKTDNKKDLSSYRKMLQRYKKFFLYRKRIIDFRLDEKELEEEILKFQQKYFFTNKVFTKADKETIFLNFDEDIFLAEAQLLYSVIIDDKTKIKFMNDIKKFEENLLPNISEFNFYFYRNFKRKKNISDLYETLRKRSKDLLINYSRKLYDNKINMLKKFLDDNKNFCIQRKKILFYLFYGCDYDKDIFLHSNEYKRRILNSVISNILNVDISDDIEISRIDKRALMYYELRILLYIRNDHVIINDFLNFVNYIICKYSRENYEKIDFSLYEVLQIFVNYVKKPELVDQLILSHKYVSSLWKNGSKFLYFYTLHNHEHSIELIKSTVHLCKIIDFFQIKSTDYFILFLSCYLHDISMVLQPDINAFSQDNQKTDEIYTEWIRYFNDVQDNLKKDSSLNEKKEINLLLQIFFDKINEYFESFVRDNHATDSALFIKTNKDLSFIEPTIRAYVSLISEAHVYKSLDVYGFRSTAKTDVVSQKYLMILLRIADLLDVSKDRVSLNILNQNICNMPEISKYHWISHAAIDKFEISTSYRFEKQSDCKVTFLEKKNFLEIITIELFVNVSSLTRVKKLNCKNVHSIIKDSSIIVELGENKKCKDDSCPFLCKWMFHKNAYLLTELNALQQYLNRSSNNIFTTRLEIKINFENVQNLPQSHFDIVESQISN